MGELIDLRVGCHLPARRDEYDVGKINRCTEAGATIKRCTRADARKKNNRAQPAPTNQIIVPLEVAPASLLTQPPVLLA